MLQIYEHLPFDSELNLVYNYYRRKGGNPNLGRVKYLTSWKAGKLEASWKLRAGTIDELQAVNRELECQMFDKLEI